MRAQSEIGGSHADPEGHATALLARFGPQTAFSMARCYAEQAPADKYWPKVVAALERFAR